MAKQYDDILLNDILPDSISDISEIKNAANIIDPELLSVSLCIREALLLSRIDELPEYMIDLLAWQYHVDMYEPLNLPINTKRSLVHNAILLHRHKGTPWSITQSLINMGFNYTKINEWWDLGTDPHTFSVELEMREGMIRQAERYINEYKPVRSHLIELICRLGIPEEICATDLLSERHYSSLIEVYPWPELLYGNINTGFKYGVTSDPNVARYGIYLKAELIVNTIRNCINDYVFAQHAYGETGLYYDGTIDYGQSTQVTELVCMSRQTTIPGDIEFTDDMIINTFYVCL